MNEMFIDVAKVKEFKNAELNEYTQEVLHIGNDVKKNFFKVASIMCKVQECKCYADDGFKDAISWAMETFKFKKSFAYNLMKIGKNYLDDKSDSTNLPHDEQDFTPNQVARLFPLKSRDKAVELINDGKIAPEMTCKEIEEVVKSEVAKAEAEKEAEDAKSGKKKAPKPPKDVVSTHVEFKICDRNGVFFAKIGREELTINEMYQYIKTLIPNLDDYIEE